MRIGDIAPSTPHRWMQRLDDDERARAEKFRFETDRLHYIAAHALTRALLGRITGLEPEKITFKTGSFGKPEILQSCEKPARFNLSHTRGLVAVAACAHGDIGIDVEDAGRMRADLDVAKRFFAPAEIEQLLAAPEAEREKMFFRFWTLKESFIKATGEGLHRALDSFAFTLDPLRIDIDGAAPGENNAWRFWERRPTPRHHMAIAQRQPQAAPMRLYETTIDPQAC